MQVEIKIPEVGESITEGILAVWLVEDGEVVATGEELFELETDKVTMAVPAEAGGRLSREVEEGDVVQVGQVVGRIETDVKSKSGREEVNAERGGVGEWGSGEDSADDPTDTAVPPIAPAAGMPQARAKIDSGALSPAVRVMVAEHDLDPEEISGTGKDGRLTKGDVQGFLSQQPVVAAVAAPPVLLAVPSVGGGESGGEGKGRGKGKGGGKGGGEGKGKGEGKGLRETRTRMSPMRQRIAERLVQAQQTAAMLTTFNEVDMSAVMAFRKKHQESFQKRHGVKLGLSSFFVSAVVDALQVVPAINARIEGDEIVQQHYYDIGMAVSTDRGLVVPVIRDAETLSFAAIEEQIADFAQRARARKLTLDELTGGSFSISNGGVFGSLVSTPILNPPQSGILGLHKIKKRPVVVDDEIVIRPMMYLALSYDHRIVDGAQAVTFLARVVQCLEEPERMLLQV